MSQEATLSDDSEALCTVVKRKATENGSEVVFKEIGVLRLVCDDSKGTALLQLSCPVRNKALWEQELESNFDYSARTSRYHTLSSLTPEPSVIGFKFNSEEEANKLKNAVFALKSSDSDKKEKMSLFRRDIGFPYNFRKTNSSSKINEMTQFPTSTDSNLRKLSLRSTEDLSHKEIKESRSSLSIFSIFKRKQSKEMLDPLGDKEVQLTKLTESIAEHSTVFEESNGKMTVKFTIPWEREAGFSFDALDDPKFNELFIKAGFSEAELRGGKIKEFIKNFIIQNSKELLEKFNLEEESDEKHDPNRISLDITENSMVSQKKFGTVLKEVAAEGSPPSFDRQISTESTSSKNGRPKKPPKPLPPLATERTEKSKMSPPDTPLSRASSSNTFYSFEDDNCLV